MNRENLRPVYFMHATGDSYVVDLCAVGTRRVKILRIVRYAQNRNGSGEEEDFFDLDSETQRAVIRWIQTKYDGKSVDVK